MLDKTGVMNKKKVQNRIIALIDFSTYSKSVVKLAEQLAVQLNAEVVFLHELSSVAPSFTPDAETRSKLAKSEEREAVQQLKLLTKPYAFDKIEFKVDNRPILQMLAELKSGGYNNWLLLGLKGTGVLKQLFIGSTALDIINNTNFLTVAVPVKEDIQLPQKIVVGVHPSYPLNEEQLHQLLDNYNSAQPSLEFVSIVLPDDDKAKFSSSMESYAAKFKAHYPSTKVIEGAHAMNDLKAYMNDKTDAFLVVQQGTRAFTDTLFRKFMINELVYSGSIPLLVLSR